MLRRYLTIAIASAAGALASTGALAQDTAKVGLVLPLTGGLAPVGKQVQAGVKAYMDKNGTTAAGKKIDLIIKDDGGVPDNSKRLAQELVVNDQAKFLMGMGLTPIALAVAPLTLVQAFSALPDWILGALVGPGDEAVERDRDLAGD